MKTRILIILIILSLSGCHGRHKLYDTFDQPRDRADLEIKYQYADPWEVARRCGNLRGFTDPFVMGCAVVYVENKCKVILPHNPPDWLVEHELRHCEGWER